jgi:hypothetical protein
MNVTGARLFQSLEIGKELQSDVGILQDQSMLTTLILVLSFLLFFDLFRLFILVRQETTSLDASDGF